MRQSNSCDPPPSRHNSGIVRCTRYSAILRPPTTVRWEAANGISTFGKYGTARLDDRTGLQQFFGAERLRGIAPGGAQGARPRDLPVRYIGQLRARRL